MFNVGEKVRIKSWDELLEIGRLNPYSNIDLPDGICFNKSMKQHCDKIVTIVRIYESHSSQCFKFDEHLGSWTFTQYMVESINDHEIEPIEFVDICDFLKI